MMESRVWIHWASIGIAADFWSGHILQSFQQLGRTPFHDGPSGLLILLYGRQLRDGLFDSFELGQGYGLVVENAVHVADELIDAEVDDSQVVQEPLLSDYCLLQFQQARVHFLSPLSLLESPKLLSRLLLAVDSDDIAHVLDGPDVHLHYSLVTQGASKEVGSAEAIDDIDAHGDGLSDDEGALAQVGQGGEGPFADLFGGAESLPFGEGEELVLVVHAQVLAEQAADLRLPPEVVVADDDALLQLADFALGGRGGQLLALLHFLVGNINYSPGAALKGAIVIRTPSGSPNRKIRQKVKQPAAYP